MRRYLLDSTLLAAYLSGRPIALKLITPWIINHQATTSIKGLKHFSLLHSQLKTLLREIYPFFLTYSILDHYTDIRRSLRPPHGKGLIGDIDTLIAATAIERSLTLATTDADFDRNIPNLKLKLIPRDSL